MDESSAVKAQTARGLAMYSASVSEGRGGITRCMRVSRTSARKPMANSLKRLRI